MMYIIENAMLYWVISNLTHTKAKNVLNLVVFVSFFLAELGDACH